MKEARTTTKGFKVIDLTLPEIQSMGSACPVCDSCNDPLLDGGIFIGVLGRKVYCQDCYDGWHRRAINYPEDMPYQDNVIKSNLMHLNRK